MRVLDRRRTESVQWPTRLAARHREGGPKGDQGMGDERLVLTDDAGNYYVLSREVLECAKVTGPDKARVERPSAGATRPGSHSRS
jgi:hypothetical protein